MAQVSKPEPEFVLLAYVGPPGTIPKRYTAHVSAKNPAAAIESLRDSLVVAETRQIQKLLVVGVEGMKDMTPALKPA